MSGEAQLMLIIAGVHFLGLGCVAALLLPVFRQAPPSSVQQTDPGTDEGGGNDRRRPTAPTDRPRGGIPLPDAVPARIRLREPGRLAERVPRRERRPAREPTRQPARI